MSIFVPQTKANEKPATTNEHARKKEKEKKKLNNCQEGNCEWLMVKHEKSENGNFFFSFRKTKKKIRWHVSVNS